MGGAITGSSFQANYEALRDTRILMRVIHGASDPSTEFTLFGKTYRTPILAAPMTGAEYNCGQGLTEADFVMAIVQGAEAAGSLGWIGDAANLALFEAGLAAARASQNAWWPSSSPGRAFRDRTPVPGRRGGRRHRPGDRPGRAAWVTMRLQGQPVGPKTLAQLKTIRAQTQLPFIVKGIMTVDEAKMCCEAGADCIVVSNHGGRVLDGCPGGADVLPEIAYALDGQIPILADGCVRSGVDALKLMALGANGVLVGRPLCWGAYGGGSQGVATVLQTYTQQLYQAMIMTGCPDLASIDGNILY